MIKALKMLLANTAADGCRCGPTCQCGDACRCAVQGACDDDCTCAI